jgi:hypothetical protein
MFIEYMYVFCMCLLLCECLFFVSLQSRLNIERDGCVYLLSDYNVLGGN